MAVFTHLTAHNVEEILTNYKIGSLKEFEGILQGQSNSNYKVETNQDTYILTLYDNITHPEFIPYFIPLMNHLASHGIPCPQVVPDLEGNLFQIFNETIYTLVTFMPGQLTDTITPQKCFEIGKALAQFHKAGTDYPEERDNDLSLAGWQHFFETCKDQCDELKTDLQTLIQKELNFLQQNWPKKLPQGAIHADLFPDNVFWQKEKLSGIIDFHFACTDFFAFDLAICMNAWCFKNGEIWQENYAKQLLAGYQSVRPLEENERIILPVLCRGAAMRFLTSRLYNWFKFANNPHMQPKNPLGILPRLDHFQKITTFEELEDIAS